MKKLIGILLVFCSLGSSGMATQQPILCSESPSSKPKESFLFVREKFSDLEDIDYSGLEEHIHYKFNNRELLRDALYPMLPKRLKAVRLKFEHLEFVGDAVLGLIIRERLVTLFPQEDRGILAELYSLLTKNQTLADVYFRHLELERYMPFPDKPSCKVCNLVESIIGGIYLDDPNGPTYAKMFVMQILNDHVLAEKIHDISLVKNIRIRPPVFLELGETIRIVCTPERLASDSPKTLLNEILLRLWNDRPTYEVLVKSNKDRLPHFSAIVTGAQIGKVLQGEGDTGQEAEEDAARNALNFLAKRELLQKKRQEIAPKTFRARLKEYLDILTYNWEFENMTPLNILKVEIKLKNKIISVGSGTSQEEARKAAASQACQFLGYIPQDESPHRTKNYRVLLKEFFDLAGLTNYKSGEPMLHQDAYSCQIDIESTVVATGTGTNKVEAKEDAAKKAFLFLKKECSAKYNPLLQLFLMLEGLDNCEFNNITSCQTFTYRVVDGNKIISEGIGLSATDAKEHAAREAYFRLIQLETEKAEHREKLKLGERLKPSTSRISTPINQPILESSILPLTPLSSQPIPKQNPETSVRKKAIRKRPGKAAKSQEQPKLDERANPSALKIVSSNPSFAGKQPSLAGSKLSQKPTPQRDHPSKKTSNSTSNKKPVMIKPNSNSETH